MRGAFAAGDQPMNEMPFNAPTLRISVQRATISAPHKAQSRWPIRWLKTSGKNEQPLIRWAQPFPLIGALLRLVQSAVLRRFEASSLRVWGRLVFHVRSAEWRIGRTRSSLTFDFKVSSFPLFDLRLVMFPWQIFTGYLDWFTAISGANDYCSLLTYDEYSSWLVAVHFSAVQIVACQLQWTHISPIFPIHFVFVYF